MLEQAWERSDAVESVLPLLLPAAAPAISLPTPAPVRPRPSDCQGPLPHICVEPDELHRWLDELDRDDAQRAVLLLWLAEPPGKQGHPVLRAVRPHKTPGPRLPQWTGRTKPY